MSERVNRRGFLQGAGASGAAAALQTPEATAAPGQATPPVVNPRATDGDERREPAWEERFTLTVGVRDGDLSGKSERVIQAAVDSVARMGGGTVRLLPGTWRLRNAVYLPSKVRLQGSGMETILTRGPSLAAKLDDDSNWFDQEITLKDARGFEVGDGVFLQAKNPHTGAPTVIKRTLTARSGNRFKLNDGLRENLWLSGEPTCSSLFPLLTSDYTSDVTIEDLVLDGNRANCVNMNGNYGGAVFIQDCSRYSFRDVVARNYNGDGFSFQICHDVVLDGCQALNNADLGIHAGSGAQRPVMRNCRMEGNDIGLFWCWGVKFGLAEKNRMSGNRSYGISIGHCDTDNLMRENIVTGSGKIGVLFRDEARGKDFWPNRNTLERNVIENSGGAEGIGIDLRGKVKEVRLVANEVRERRAPMSRVGIKIGSDVQRLHLEGNTVDGCATSVLDERK